MQRQRRQKETEIAFRGPRSAMAGPRGRKSSSSEVMEFPQLAPNAPVNEPKNRDEVDLKKDSRKTNFPKRKTCVAIDRLNY